IRWEANGLTADSDPSPGGTLAFEIGTFFIRGSNTYVQLVPGSITSQFPGSSAQFNIRNGTISDSSTLNLNCVTLQVRQGLFTVLTNSGLIDNCGSGSVVKVEGGEIANFGFIG